jgi:hypothetical protein
VLEIALLVAVVLSIGLNLLQVIALWLIVRLLKSPPSPYGPVV